MSSSSYTSINSLSSPTGMWGVELSPFALKLAAMLEWAGIHYRWLPRQGRRLENIAAAFRVERAKRSGRVLRHEGSS